MRTTLLELFQLQNDEGPCLDAFSTKEPVISVDLRADKSRWPIFAPEAVDAGFRSVHAIPLRLRETVIGALNLFGDHVGGMPEADLRIATALADAVSIAILQSEIRAATCVHSPAIPAAISPPWRSTWCQEHLRLTRFRQARRFRPLLSIRIKAARAPSHLGPHHRSESGKPSLVDRLSL